MNGKLLVGHSFPRFHVITETESFLFSTLNLPPILHVAYVFPLQAIISCKLLCLGEDAQIPTTWPVTNALTPVIALSVSRLVDTLAESLDLHFGSLWIKARLDVVVGDTKQLKVPMQYCFLSENALRVGNVMHTKTFVTILTILVPPRA